MAERVRATCAQLAAHAAARPDAPVAVIAQPDLHCITMLYALIELGSTIALLHPRWTEAEREAFCNACGAIRANEQPLLAFPVPSLSDARPRDQESILAIVATSGSTGQPRGARLSRRAFLASAAASATNLGWQDEDRWMLSLPLAHVGGLSVLTRCLLARRAVVVPARVGVAFDALEAFKAAAERDRATIASLVPAQLSALLEGGWNPPRHMRALLVGGGASSPLLLAQALRRSWPILATYGLTEACSQVAIWKYGQPRDPDGDLSDSGLPLKGIEVRLLDGTLQVRGPTLMSGYTSEGPRTPSDDGWLASRDAATIDAAGRLHILGRVDDVILSGGENVHPGEVELALERCPGVSAACVFGIPDARWGQCVAAAVVLDAEASVPISTITAALAKQLAPFKRPRRIATLPELSLTPAGKLDRAATRARGLAQLDDQPTGSTSEA
jgi:O-succinylbenzoic acid--CoA ligase